MIRIFTTFLVIVFFSGAVAYADGNNSRMEELIDRHQAKLDNVRPNDWRSYAECADEVLSLRVTSPQVLKWIKTSIEIEETVYNRTVLGDYLVLEGKFTAAKQEYIKAIGLAQVTGEEQRIPDLQWKILVAMGIENYHSFHANKE